MQSRILAIIGCLLISFLVGNILGLWGTFRRWRVLRQQREQVLSQAFPLTRFDAYREYARIHTRSSRLAYKPLSFAIFFVSGILGGFISTDPVVLRGMFCYMLCGFLVGLWLQEIISGITLDTQALRTFQINHLPERKYASTNIYSKLFLITPAPDSNAFIPGFFLALFMCLFQLGFAFGLISGTVQLDLLCLFSVLLFLSFDLFPYQYARLTASLQPIEETQWASLLPRITTWASMAGIMLSSIQIAQDPIGKHSVRVVGRGQHPILVVGEALLHASEWRVQDALICLALSNHKMRVADRLFKRNLWLLALVCAGIPASFFAAPRVSNPLNIGAFIFLLSLLIAAIAIMVFYPGKTQDKVDSFAARLTGDPLALVVAHYLVASLNGMELRWDKKNTGEIEQRINNILTMRGQLWPQAPYAPMLVPSILSISLNGHQITVSPQAVTPPVPIPSMPYMSVAP